MSGKKKWLSSNLVYILVAVGIAVIAFLGMAVPWRAAWLAVLANPTLVVYIVPGIILLLAFLAWLFGALAAWQKSEHHDRVAAILGVLSREASDILLALKEHPPAAPDVLNALKQALMSKSVDYVQGAMPGFVGSTGYTPEKLTRALSGLISDKALATGSGPALMTSLTTFLQNAVTTSVTIGPAPDTAPGPQVAGADPAIPAASLQPAPTAA